MWLKRIVTRCGREDGRARAASSGVAAPGGSQRGAGLAASSGSGSCPCCVRGTAGPAGVAGARRAAVGVGPANADRGRDDEAQTSGRSTEVLGRRAFIGRTATLRVSEGTEALADQPVDVVLPLEHRLAAGREAIADAEHVAEVRRVAIGAKLVVPLPDADPALQDVARLEDPLRGHVTADPVPLVTEIGCGAKPEAPFAPLVARREVAPSSKGCPLVG